MSKLILQIISAIVGLLTVGLASMQLIFGINSPIYGQGNLPVFPILDSNLRFFGGIGLGLGLLLLWCISDIEQKTLAFRIGWGLALIGGIGRLISYFAVGSPSTLLIVFTVLEVIGAPIFIYWQTRLANQASQPRDH